MEVQPIQIIIALFVVVGTSAYFFFKALAQGRPKNQSHGQAQTIVPPAEKSHGQAQTIAPPAEESQQHTASAEAQSIDSLADFLRAEKASKKYEERHAQMKKARAKKAHVRDGNVVVKSWEKIDVSKQLAVLKSSNATEKETFDALRIIRKTLDLCKTTEMRMRNKSAELCTQMLHENGLDLINGVSSKFENSEMADFAGQLIGDIVPLIWSD